MLPPGEVWLHEASDSDGSGGGGGVRRGWWEEVGGHKGGRVRKFSMTDLLCKSLCWLDGSWSSTIAYPVLIKKKIIPKSTPPLCYYSLMKPWNPQKNPPRMQPKLQIKINFKNCLWIWRSKVELVVGSRNLIIRQWQEIWDVMSWYFQFDWTFDSIFHPVPFWKITLQK